MLLRLLSPHHHPHPRTAPPERALGGPTRSTGARGMRAPARAPCGAGLLVLAGLVAPAVISGFEIQLEYAEATPMTRAYHRQQQRVSASRRLQRLGPNGAPPPRTLELGKKSGVYYVTL